MDNFDPYMYIVFLAISTNKTGFVLQGHIYDKLYIFTETWKIVSSLKAHAISWNCPKDSTYTFINVYILIKA